MSENLRGWATDKPSPPEQPMRFCLKCGRHEDEHFSQECEYPEWRYAMEERMDNMCWPCSNGFHYHLQHQEKYNHRLQPTQDNALFEITDCKLPDSPMVRWQCMCGERQKMIDSVRGWKV